MKNRDKAHNLENVSIAKENFCIEKETPNKRVNQTAKLKYIRKPKSLKHQKNLIKILRTFYDIFSNKLSETLFLLTFLFGMNS
jgi:hypothetical protein